MKPAARHKARALAVQAIYSWQISQNSPSTVELEFVTQRTDEKVDVEYFRELFRGTVENVEKLDEMIKPHTARAMDSLDPVEKAILRLAAFELSERVDVPYRVVINEAIELAKSFAAQDSHRFVNGVLDKAVKDIRTQDL